MHAAFATADEEPGVAERRHTPTKPQKTGCWNKTHKNQGRLLPKTRNTVIIYGAAKTTKKLNTILTLKSKYNYHINRVSCRIEPRLSEYGSNKFYLSCLLGKRPPAIFNAAHRGAWSWCGTQVPGRALRAGARSPAPRSSEWGHGFTMNIFGGPGRPEYAPTIELFTRIVSLHMLASFFLQWLTSQQTSPV